ncbi:bikaverin cluster-transcription factor [Fusarium circinatum]|uniref:Bikaverin cluster-transcription factor n=1 Tax=Fusarium circinatum TaxID=48490 RepID=A0A8H5WT82_FUSCI|nr:bikaverin cluster-transcription factor [Fusarium circinatum]DAZ85507.1 TPA_exp: Bik5 [Fusarium circinatum]
MDPTLGNLSMSSLAQSHVQVRTCIHCRQRRVKCDRQFPQCSNCIRSEVNCIYPPGRGRAPKRPKRSLAPQLSERLSRLESIIGQFGAAARENQDTPQTAQDSDGHSFEQDFSRLKVDESKSYYVNNALWVTLSNEVEELRDLLFEPASEDAGYEPSISSSATTAATSPSSPQLGLNAAIFGYRAIASPLYHYHPSLQQAVTLFAAFSENVAPLVRIFHMPTLTRIYWDAIASLGTVDKHTETLLFTIHYSAVISLNPEQCLNILDETREAALERYRFAVEQALAQGNLLSTQSMTMLQAAVLFLSALPNEDDSRAAWALTSLVFHIARTMGLHRDGTIFGLKPFETELRRRLWWQICIIDSRSSEYHCNEPIAQGFITDTKPPLHINDVDLSPEMVEPPAERWDHATDMTLTLVRCEAIQTGLKLGRMRHKQNKASDDGATPRVDDTSDSPKTLVQELESRLRDKYLPICDTTVPFQLLSSAVAQIILGRFWLITQYSVVSREKDVDSRNTNNQFPPTPNTAGQLENKVRDELFQTSIKILEVSGMLLTSKEIIQFTWYSKTHIQWGAMAFVLSELCARPQSLQCEQAWDCVTTVYEGWKVDESRQDETRLALWRPIKRLMAKARYVKEMQQTTPGRSSNAGRKVQRRDPVLYSPSPGLFSQYPTPAYSDNWYGPLQQTPSSIPASDASLPGLAAAPLDSSGQSDALQRVLGTETLGPFMDMIPEWPWVDAEQGASSLAGFDLGLPRFS